METTIAVASILGALLVGAMSPGPSFVLVARTAIATSRRDGIAAALGMGMGGVIFGGLVLLGLRTILTEVAWLYLVLKIAGGVYLIYLAVRLWRCAAEPVEMQVSENGDKRSLTRSFILGLTTQISNPKTAIVYASVFAALLPAAPAGWVFATLLLGIFLNEAGWYTLVACVFSAPRPRAVYLRSKTLIDRMAGLILGALGIRLIADGLRPG